MLKIYNSISKKIEKFKPLNSDRVGMYTCGPTVYDYAHIGHARKYVGDDLIKRSLKYLGYSVNHVMNITDVGHLVSDSDEGEDKMEKGAQKSGKTVWEVADYFTQDFIGLINQLNIESPSVLCKATDHIHEQIEQINQLMTKGYAYDTPEAVYFDISKFKDYFKLFGQKIKDKLVAARTEVNQGNYKKSPSDFVLWFKRVGIYKNHTMHWNSPWGDGFPGWHIECSAMSVKYLGEQFDIHTGGIDHLSIHHPNEIAQAECATGKKPFVNYWIHHNFLLVDGEKMSKSKGNFYRIIDLIKMNYTSMQLRYYFLNTHYRKQLNFTLTGLDSAKNSYSKLVRIFSTSAIDTQTKNKKLKVSKVFLKRFVRTLEDDFNFAMSLSVLWDLFKSELHPEVKVGTALEFDKVLGLKLEELITDPKISTQTLFKKSEDINKIIEQREEYRKKKNWEKSDELRHLLKTKYNIEILDTKEGSIIQ